VSCGRLQRPIPKLLPAAFPLARAGHNPATFHPWTFAMATVTSCLPTIRELGDLSASSTLKLSPVALRTVRDWTSELISTAKRLSQTHNLSLGSDALHTTVKQY
jgi:hypothetical protein